MNRRLTPNSFRKTDKNVLAADLYPAPPDLPSRGRRSRRSRRSGRRSTGSSGLKRLFR